MSLKAQIPKGIWTLKLMGNSFEDLGLSAKEIIYTQKLYCFKCTDISKDVQPTSPREWSYIDLKYTYLEELFPNRGIKINNS